MGGTLSYMTATLTEPLVLPSAQVRAAVYVRISHDKEGKALGVERQEALCRSLAERLGWTVTGVYSDNDISASTRSRKTRPDYQRLLRDIDAGRVSGVLAYSTSRLTRRPREFEDWIERVETRGAAIQTVKAGEVDLSTAAGRAIARTLAAFDAMYAETISEQVMDQKAQAREKGLPLGGPRAFGHLPRYAGIHPVEGPLVRSGARAVLGGASLRSVAATWREAVHVTPQGGEVVPRFVRDVLLSPRHVPDLISETDHAALSAILRDPSRKAGEKAHAVHFLSGLALCGRCGATVHMGGTGSPGARRSQYRCSATSHLQRLAEPLDTYVSEQVLGYLQTVGARPGGGGGDRAEALGRESVSLRATLDGLAGLLVEGVLTVEGVRAESARLRARLAEVEGELASGRVASILDEAPEDADALEAWWADLDIPRRREVVKALGVTVFVMPPRLGRPRPINEGHRDVLLFWTAREAEEQRRRIRGLLG